MHEIQPHVGHRRLNVLLSTNADIFSATFATLTLWLFCVPKLIQIQSSFPAVGAGAHLLPSHVHS
jgi:hypothetical protein